jgi:hypothetical protein
MGRGPAVIRTGYGDRPPDRIEVAAHLRRSSAWSARSPSGGGD